MSAARAERRRDREATQRWLTELSARYTSAGSPDARAGVLQMLDLPYTLDEDTALALYAVQPQLCTEFIQRHLPRGRRADDARLPWTRLMGQALWREDQALHFALYRMQAAPEEWQRDTAELARRIADPATLCSELERRHPQRWRADVGPHLHAMALERGEHLLPYLEAHAPEVWNERRHIAYEPMAQLAHRRGWWELWGVLVRSCAPVWQYDREVASLVQDTQTPEADLRQRLLALAGVWSTDVTRRRSRARLKPLREDTILALYTRFPHLARGPFRAQLEPSATRPLAAALDLAIERRDDELIDHLASRLVARTERSGAERLLHAAARVADYVERTETDLGQRAAAILLRLPYTGRSARELLQTNVLARLLFHAAARACIEQPQVAASMLESDAVAVRALAVVAISTDDARAAASAQRNFERLLAAMDRALPRRIWRQAVAAMQRRIDATHDTAKVVAWARDCLGKTSEKAPDPALLGLLGVALDRHPELREAGEERVVYHRSAA